MVKTLLLSMLLQYQVMQNLSASSLASQCCLLHSYRSMPPLWSQCETWTTAAHNCFQCNPGYFPIHTQVIFQSMPFLKLRELVDTPWPYRDKFSQTITGEEEELAELSFVFPECHFNSRIPLLIGTNVLFRLYEHALEWDGPEFICKLSSKDFPAHSLDPWSWQ